MKPHPSKTSISVASKVVMHRDPPVISKFKPKIRIIHIFALEIIKTDVENFRGLAQRLTGKPVDSKSHTERTSAPTKEPRTFIPKPSKNIESENSIHSFQNGNRMKKGEELWGGENSNCFIGGFGCTDGLIQDVSEFPLLPLKSSHFNVCEGMPLFQ